MQPDIWDMHEMAGWRENTFGDDGVDMAVPMDKIAERLHGADYCGNADVAVDLQRIYVAYRFPGCAAELAQQAPIKTEVNPQSFRYRENPLTMGHMSKHFILEAVRKQK
jgi:hypothetical protein